MNVTIRRRTVAGLGLLALIVVPGCGGGADVPRSASASTGGAPVGASGLSPAARSALPAHVSANDLRRNGAGCYSYRVGDASLGYDVPLIAADGTQVCS